MSVKAEGASNQPGLLGSVQQNRCEGRKLLMLEAYSLVKTFKAGAFKSMELLPVFLLALEAGSLGVGGWTNRLIETTLESAIVHPSQQVPAFHKANSDGEPYDHPQYYLTILNTDCSF